jgi:hypothetical protein
MKIVLDDLGQFPNSCPFRSLFGRVCETEQKLSDWAVAIGA